MDGRRQWRYYVWDGNAGLYVCISHRPVSRCGSASFFFFQAEDGIRDYKVTGVQTCALPIWSTNGSAESQSRMRSCCARMTEKSDFPYGLALRWSTRKAS